MENQIVIYQTDNGQTAIDVRLENETVWLTQAQMALLFQKDQSVIARHIANVFKEGELDKKSNMQILHNTLSKYRPTAIYNLDVVISVGYRVKSQLFQFVLACAVIWHRIAFSSQPNSKTNHYE